LYYILASIINKAISTPDLLQGVCCTDELWMKLILLPEDYSKNALNDIKRRELMKKIDVVYGGPTFD